MYNVFHRTWWKPNPKWPNGKEPHAGEKHYLLHNVDEESAVDFCKEWNERHDAGWLSDKAEYEEA
jgi:hypothetical protein